MILMQSSCQKAEIVEVIKIISVEGNGEEYPYREVIQYWTKDGNLISEKPNTQ